jgi:hypothetical protein
VYEAFSVFGQPIRIQLGQKIATLTPNERGVANSKDATFRVLSEHKYGVVYGGLLEFEMILRGPDWLAEIKKATGAQSNSSQTALLDLSVGNVRHSTAIPIDQILKADLSRQ